MAKYRCDKSKDEILEIVVKHFNKANDIGTGDPEEWAVYRAMLCLLTELKIYEADEK